MAKQGRRGALTHLHGEAGARGGSSAGGLRSVARGGASTHDRLARSDCLAGLGDGPIHI
jgi:hypothetical protein